MSHSGSLTPTNNPDITKSPQSTASQPQIIDDSHLSEHRNRRPVTPPSLESQIAESSSKRRTTPESSTDKPMAKRIRRDSFETRGRATRHHSASSFDSQDEMVMEHDRRPEPLAPTTTPPKKKRTRTLTTPQQSAVLHALLAKSRFPTTAMREDVGRSIGLSARKVQIWFQNQRQKARRPRSQSDAPLTRPPQYGPFPSAPGSSSSVRGYEEYPAAHLSYPPQYPTPEAQPSQPDTPARLLGPGVPGPAIRAPPPPYQPVAGPSTSVPPIESRFPGSRPPRRSESPQYYRSPRQPSHTSARYLASHPSSRHPRERDPLRTLPPLVPSSTHSTRRTHTPSSSLPSRIVHGLQGLPPHPISPESRFTRVSPEITSRPSRTLPPPFAMQPSPQWNPTQFQSAPRHISSPWSRGDSRSTIERSIMPSVTARREHIMGSSTTDPPWGHHHPERGAPPPHSASSSRLLPPSPPAPPSRPGRYDPVRATFITRATPTPPRVRSPGQQRSENIEEEIHSDRKSPKSPKENR